MLSAIRKHTTEPAPERAPRAYRENKAQARVVSWLRDRPDWMVMRLENAQKRTPQQAARDKALGMEPGAPDLVVLYKRTVIFLEMKDGERGALKPDQENVHEQLRLRGQLVITGYGYDDAIARLEGVARDLDQEWRESAR